MDKLYGNVAFTGVTIGGTQTLPHGLVLRGTPVIPDLVLLQFPNDFELVTADATSITIRNTTNTTGDCVAQVSAFHPTIRLLGAPPDDGVMSQGLTPRPFCPGSPNSGSSGASSFDVVVFRPGGGAGENVVATWADALAALAQLEGTRYLQFDDSLVSPIPIPVGGPYDMTGVIWSTVPDRIVQVVVPEGVTFTKLRAFDDRIAVTFTGTAPPVADFASPAPQIDTVSFSGNAQIIATGGGPFFSVGAAAQFNLGTAGAILFGGAAVIDVTAGVVLNVFVNGPLSSVQGSTISGVLGATLNLVTANDALTVLSEDQPTFAGAINPTNRTGVRRYPTAILTSTDSLADANQLVLVDPTGGAFSVTLPAAAGLRGQPIVFKNVDTSTNNVTIAAGGGDTIDGSATLVKSGSRFFCEITSDGVHTWYVTG